MPKGSLFAGRVVEQAVPEKKKKECEESYIKLVADEKAMSGVADK